MIGTFIAAVLVGGFCVLATWANWGGDVDR